MGQDDVRGEMHAGAGSRVLLFAGIAGGESKIMKIKIIKREAAARENAQN